MHHRINRYHKHVTSESITSWFEIKMYLQDMDLYKATVKDDIESWLRELSSRDVNDWLIVVVENYDGKRTNKLLPRTTVLDKIRTDFAPKQGMRRHAWISIGT